MNQVSIRKCRSYDLDEVRNSLRQLLEPLGGMKAFVRQGETVLLKPNMLSAKPPEAAVTTHPAVLQAVIEQVLEAGGKAIVGDSPGIGGCRRVAEKAGILAVVEKTGAQLAPFDEAIDAVGTGTFKRFKLARTYLEADRVINLPKLKTHEMMTMTCAVKNLFGAVVGTEKAGWHLKAGADRALFAKMLLEIYLLRPPDLNIIDAVTAMEGDGPGSGDPRHVGLLLGGEDPVAVDVIAAEIVGIPRKLLWVEQAALRLGLQGAERSTITTCGEIVDEVRVPDFRLPHQSDVQFGLPTFLKNRLRHYLTSRPGVDMNKCMLCGICRDACPPGAIAIAESRLQFDYHNCIRCFCCRELCPEAALTVTEGSLLKVVKWMQKGGRARH